MSKTKNKIVALLVTSSFPVMLFFQNCGQQGSLQVTSNGLAANSSMEAGSDIPKDPVDDGGMVIVPPSLPPVSQPATSSPPSVPQDPTSPSQPPVQQPPVVVNPPVVQPPAGGAPGSPGQVPQDPNVPGTVPKLDCRQIQIADIRLNIDSVGAQEGTCGNKNRNAAGDNRPDFEFVDSSSMVSLNSPVIRVRALKSFEVKQLFVRLAATGNAILSMDNVAMELVTPSAQESGLKFQLKKAVKVEVDQIYEIRFEIHPEDQIVANPVKCILKPVIKSASLVLVR